MTALKVLVGPFLFLWNTKMTALKVLVGPFLFLWKTITETYKKILDFCDWITKHKPLTLAFWFFWILFVAYASKPLFGNTFSLNGWKNAFDEPWGFVIFGTTVIVAVVLIVSQIRSRPRSRRSSMLSKKWNLRYLQATRAIIVIIPIAYFLFYTLQGNFFNDSGATPSSIGKHNQPLQLTTTPTTTPTITSTTTPTIVEATLTGTEEFGVKLFDLEPDQSAQVTYAGGRVCALAQKGSVPFCISLWGFQDSNTANYRYANRNNLAWAEAYRYAHVSDVKAGDTVVVLGEMLNGKYEKVFQFPEGETELTVKNSTKKTRPLNLYLNVMVEFWEDSSPYIFPTEAVANSFGHNNAHYQRGFQPRYYRGSMKFSAEILNH